MSYLEWDLKIILCYQNWKDNMENTEPLSHILSYSGNGP